MDDDDAIGRGNVAALVAKFTSAQRQSAGLPRDADQTIRANAGRAEPGPAVTPAGRLRDDDGRVRGSDGLDELVREFDRISAPPSFGPPPRSSVGRDVGQDRPPGRQGRGGDGKNGPPPGRQGPGANRRTSRR